jgi:hypothetical protein
MLSSVMVIAPVSGGRSRNAQLFEGALRVANCMSFSENWLKQHTGNSAGESVSFAEHVYKIIPQLWARNLANCQSVDGEMNLFVTHAQKIRVSLKMLDTSKHALDIIRILVNL